MTLQNFHSYMTLQTSLLEVEENLTQLLQLFAEMSGVGHLECYKYDNNYNTYNLCTTIPIKSNQDNIPENKKIELTMKKRKIIFGKMILDRKIKSVNGLKRLNFEIKRNLLKRYEIEQQLFATQNMYDISIIYDESLGGYASELMANLKTIFNVEIFMTTSLLNKIQELKNRKLKHIIVYVIKDSKTIDIDKNILESINEFVVVIGPHDLAISMYCGKLGIQKYLEFDNFNLENLKDAIITSKNTLVSKHHEEDKIFAVSGMSGGIGTTTISINCASIMAQNLPDKNILYVDLSTTKGVSNLFLSKNPIPTKTIVDLVNNDFDIENNLKSGLYKVTENFYAITAIQRQIDKDVLDDDHFVEKLLTYLSQASKHFNYIFVDTGMADASHLKTMVYDLSSEIWLVTQMTLPHISVMKTFYALLKRAGMKEKTNFLINRYDSNSAISIDDVISILNLRDEDKMNFNFRIKNDYATLGPAWNYCELASDVNPSSIFVKSLIKFLQQKQLISKIEDNKKEVKIFGFLDKLLGRYKESDDE